MAEPGNTIRKSPLRRIADLASYMLSHSRRRTLLALACLMLSSLSEGLTILLIVPVLQLIGPGGDTVTIGFPARWFPSLFDGPLQLGLVAVLVALVVLVTAQSLFNRFKSIYMAELLYDVVSHARTTLFDAIGRARWSYISSVRGSDLQHAVTTDIDRLNAACTYLLLLIQDLVLLVAYLLLSWMISPAMTVFAFVTGAAVLVVLRPIRRRASSYGERLTENRQEQFRTVSEFLNGMKLAKSFNAEPRYVAELMTALDGMRAEFSRFLRISTLGNVVFQISSAALLSVFVYAGLRFFALPLAELVVLVFLFSRISPRFSSVQSDLQELLVSLPAFSTTQQLEAECREQVDEATSVSNVAPLARAIRFRGVRYAYPGRSGEPVLDGVSLEIPARRVTALIGPSGSGKSTIADLMMGLIEPDSGSVEVDGVPLSAASRRAWREQIAYVPQEVFLLHASIAANMRLARPEADEEEMWDALRAAHAAEFVTKLPAGLDTLVGDRGQKLSGGERQRIALARAILRKPNLLILDEATSALDWESQSLIARSIEELRDRMTILTIAHRPSMIAFADWIIAIDEGAVIEQGEFGHLRSQRNSRLSLMLSGEAEKGPRPAGGAR